MCTTSNKILKPLPGEQFFINAKKITNADATIINNFILFARRYNELKKLSENGNTNKNGSQTISVPR